MRLEMTTDPEPHLGMWLYAPGVVPLRKLSKFEACSVYWNENVITQLRINMRERSGKNVGENVITKAQMGGSTWAEPIWVLKDGEVYHALLSPDRLVSVTRQKPPHAPLHSHPITTHHLYHHPPFLSYTPNPYPPPTSYT